MKQSDRCTIWLEKKDRQRSFDVIIYLLGVLFIAAADMGHDILLVPMSMVLGSTDCGATNVALAMKRMLRTIECIMLVICCLS